MPPQPRPRALKQPLADAGRQKRRAQAVSLRKASRQAEEQARRRELPEGSDPAGLVQQLSAGEPAAREQRVWALGSSAALPAYRVAVLQAGALPALWYWPVATAQVSAHRHGGLPHAGGEVLIAAPRTREAHRSGGSL